MVSSGLEGVLDTTVEKAYRDDAKYILSVAPALFVVGLAVEACSHVGRATPSFVWLHSFLALASFCLFIFMRLYKLDWRYPEFGLGYLCVIFLTSVLAHSIYFGGGGQGANLLVLSLGVVGFGALVLPTIAGILGLMSSSGLLFVLFYLDSAQDPFGKITVPVVITFVAILVFLARRWNVRQALQHRKRDAQLHEQTAKLQAAKAVAETSTRLSASFAHHFNNQLQSVLLGADGVMMMLPDNHPSKEMLVEIQNSALRGADMISSLLRYASDAPIKKERFPAQPFVDDFQFEQALAEAGQHNIDVDDVEIFADRNLLANVILELIRNASHAVAPLVGRVDLQIEALGDEIVITLTDNGEGIPLDLRADATAPFVTSEPASRFGLGLALVTSIVERHEGTLEIAYSHQAGTQIRVSLPSEDKKRTKSLNSKDVE